MNIETDWGNSMLLQFVQQAKYRSVLVTIISISIIDIYSSHSTLLPVSVLIFEHFEWFCPPIVPPSYTEDGFFRYLICLQYDTVRPIPFCVYPLLTMTSHAGFDSNLIMFILH